MQVLIFTQEKHMVWQVGESIGPGSLDICFVSMHNNGYYCSKHALFA